MTSAFTSNSNKKRTQSPNLQDLFTKQLVNPFTSSFPSIDLNSTTGSSAPSPFIPFCFPFANPAASNEFTKWPPGWENLNSEPSKTPSENEEKYFDLSGSEDTPNSTWTCSSESDSWDSSRSSPTPSPASITEVKKKPAAEIPKMKPNTHSKETPFPFLTPPPFFPPVGDVANGTSPLPWPQIPLLYPLETTLPSESLFTQMPSLQIPSVETYMINPFMTADPFNTDEVMENATISLHQLDATSSPVEIPVSSPNADIEYDAEVLVEEVEPQNVKLISTKSKITKEKKKGVKVVEDLDLSVNRGQRGRAIHPAIFKCEHEGCNKVFTRQYNLRSHYKVHTGEKLHTCEVCDVKFIRGHDLRRHLRLHTNERPFPCPRCDKSFARSDALKRHIKVDICGDRSSDFEEENERVESVDES
ncbi:hypothetical protein HK096_004131 [Nowakowskiella sp. JEL0078]|nr:hypothetical protein HK096_004131 [Nowakowskiella sp. JEL0078]